MSDLPSSAWSRRRFIEFMGRGGLAAAGLSLSGPLASCTSALKKTGLLSDLPFSPMRPTSKDDFIVASAFDSHLIIRWKDQINHNPDFFGINCDYTAFIPFTPSNPNDGLLWVNHEYPSPLLINGKEPILGEKRDRAEVLREMEACGGSIVRIKKNPQNGKWSYVQNDPYNKRITALTRIPFAATQTVLGHDHAIGMIGNCSGGITPWGTVLTCEENYGDFYLDREFNKGTAGKRFSENNLFGWHTVFNHPPEHYGWVVEISPFSGKAKKILSLGRFEHEGATCVESSDKRTVVYMGDDAMDQCIYKFIAARPGTLEDGTLYVANTETGKWLMLDYEKTPGFQKHFISQTDMLIQTRKAAQLVGGTPQNRPEGIAIDPLTGAVYVSLTNNAKRKDYFGSILKIVEKDNNPLSLEFTAHTFIAGGEKDGFACPDNIAFDHLGNLWMTTDMSASKMNKPGEYEPYKNNGLFFIPTRGTDAGKAFQVASGPIGSELTGPSFSPDGRTLFLSVQHPGEGSKDINALSSHWPDGGSSLPRSSVVGINLPEELWRTS